MTKDQFHAAMILLYFIFIAFHLRWFYKSVRFEYGRLVIHVMVPIPALYQGLCAFHVAVSDTSAGDPIHCCVIIRSKRALEGPKAARHH